MSIYSHLISLNLCHTMSSRLVSRANSLNYGRHSVNDRISSLVNSDYGSQLMKKQKVAENVLLAVGKKLFTANKGLKISARGHPCPLEPIKGSPLLSYYRNKDEFSVWTGLDGQSPVVGFLSGSLSRPDTYCIEPDLTVTTKEGHKRIAAKFQIYLRDITELKICKHFNRPEGNWRRFVVRSNQDNQLMAICIMHPKVLTPKELNDEKDSLVDYFRSFAEELSLRSLYFQACRKERCDSLEAPFQLLYGEPTIYENLCGHKFTISPGTFFQVNTSGAEMLYETIYEKLNTNENSVVIDMNCEVGSAVIPIASKVKKVYGIDSSLSNISAANSNAQSNGIFNYQFFCGDLLETLGELFQKLANEQSVVIIAKPNRGGLENSILSLIREFEPVKQIVYYSSKPDSVNAISNFVHLCKSFRSGDAITGGHFTPVVGIPVDLFPQTTHLGLLMVFERDEIHLFQ